MSDAPRDEFMFCCPICLTDTPYMESVAGGECGHLFCLICMQTYLTGLLKEGKTDAGCPYVMTAVSGRSKSCGSLIPSAEVRSIVGREVVERLDRNLALASEDARVCPGPNCTAIVWREANAQAMPEPSNGLTTAARQLPYPHQKCATCATVFCWFHGVAHGESEKCADYEKRINNSEKASITHIKQTCMKCPKCKAPTFRTEGCNHMYCSRCRVGWCYACGCRRSWCRCAPRRNACLFMFVLALLAIGVCWLGWCGVRWVFFGSRGSKTIQPLPCMPQPCMPRPCFAIADRTRNNNIANEAIMMSAMRGENWVTSEVTTFMVATPNSSNVVSFATSCLPFACEGEACPTTGLAGGAGGRVGACEGFTRVQITTTRQPPAN